MIPRPSASGTAAMRMTKTFHQSAGAAIVVLDGQASVVTDGGTAGLSAQSGTTIAGGAKATVRSATSSARVLIVELLRPAVAEKHDESQLARGVAH